jgi:sulfur-carrier protein adenylyltransferase/sulfurtransferase
MFASRTSSRESSVTYRARPLIPLATVESAMKAWDREKDVAVVCRSGGRSANASRQLVELGFTRVMNLRGGMLAYNAAKLPVVFA